MSDVWGGGAGFHKPQLLLLLGNHVAEQENSLEGAKVGRETGLTSEDVKMTLHKMTEMRTPAVRGACLTAAGPRERTAGLPQTLLGSRNLAEDMPRRNAPERVAWLQREAGAWTKYSERPVTGLLEELGAGVRDAGV